MDLDPNETINVEFFFADPKENDFHSIRTLLTQHFGANDAKLFDLSGLADLLVRSDSIGTCVAVEEGDDAEPYGFLCLVDMTEHRGKSCIKQIIGYLLEKAKEGSGNKAALAQLQKLFGAGSEERVGLLLSERFVNMPLQIVPPLYRMLRDELQSAVDNEELSKITTFILLSKTYRLLEQPDDEGAENKAEKIDPNELHFVNEEDQFIEKHAQLSFKYKLTHSDEFGADTTIVPGRKCMIISADSFNKLPDVLEKILPSQ
ncbi:hypothetical protein GQ42DRAFT_120363 [Ramicandelaber brevisporus]|nr:hypothetical protein GQ42DRAFT_120363 [Ramicandelaber brevisporus]